MAEAVPGPSTSGSVVLDVGPGTGALVLYTPPALDGAEVEISRIGGEPEPRTHSQVRQRQLPGRVHYAAVYPGIPAGDYAIWRDASNQPAATVTVASGEITTTHWPA